MTDTTQLIDTFKKKREELEQAKINLKKYFIGLDNIIDKVVQNIETWYVFPEIINRPVIINLWGMTGVGKTDLIRKLVKELKMTDSFVEIQMDSQNQIGDYSSLDTVQKVLAASSIEEELPGILLLDEMQRFRSVGPGGDDEEVKHYNDVWSLLSDGKFITDSSAKKELGDLLMDILYEQQSNREEKEEEDDHPVRQRSPCKVQNLGKKKKKKPTLTFHNSVWFARRLKRAIKATESVEDVMQWDVKMQIKKIYDKLNDNTCNENKSYSKLLIFVCGNLDEAYDMASMVQDADIDADILHKHSLKINLVNIKNALQTRFKPEQISRFGNIHIIYPSLNSTHYKQLIAKKIDEIFERVSKQTNVVFNASQSVQDAIYRNGVFPAQGVRPLFSTIGNIIENFVPKVVITALEQDVYNVSLDYESDLIKCNIKNIQLEQKIQCDIDRIRRSYTKDKRIMHSIHEAGHALAYCMLFNVVPAQVKICATSFEGAYNFPHMFDNSCIMIENKIQVFFAGLSAEQMVFGLEKRSLGCTKDVEMATASAAHSIRAAAAGETLSKVVPMVAEDSARSNVDIDPTNIQIEKMLRINKVKCDKLLQLHKPLLKAISDHLLANGEVTCEELVNLVKPYNPNIKILDAEISIIENYDQIYNDFFKEGEVK